MTELSDAIIKQLEKNYIEKQKVKDALKKADNLGFDKTTIKWIKTELFRK